MLRPFAPSMAAEVAACYNEMIALIPHTHPVPVEWFADPGARHSLHYEMGEQEQEVMVAEEGGRVVGFTHVATAPPPKEDWHPKESAAVIRCLVYPPGQRRVGQQLLDWAEAWARARGKREVMAWHALYGYPCQSPWTSLSDRIGHMRALFGMAGYAPVLDQLYLTWHDFAPPESAGGRPDFDFEVRTEQQAGHTGPRLKLFAMQGRTWLGECEMDRGHASPIPEGDDWCYCAGLSIADAFQGKRLGLHLLAVGLQEMHRAGCRHASISTTGDNYRAALFYTNLGYRYLDHSAAWRKELGDAAGEAR